MQQLWQEVWANVVLQAVAKLQWKSTIKDLLQGIKSSTREILSHLMVMMVASIKGKLKQKRQDLVIPLQRLCLGQMKFANLKSEPMQTIQEMRQLPLNLAPRELVFVVQSTCSSMKKRIFEVRRMILAQSLEERLDALRKLLPFQEEDFYGIFNVMGHRPVTIRLLDPPLHEFLPKEKDDIEALAKEMKMSADHLTQVVESMEEFNPMLGHRGCRLAITWPEIYEMQVEAIIKAAIRVTRETGFEVKPEIMIPLVGFNDEFKILKKLVDDTAERIFEEMELRIPFDVGTMIEVPRAALTADEIAENASFFSFGTNDLTQMTLGFSRDDSGKFIGEYRKKHIFEKDPFETIDQVRRWQIDENGCRAWAVNQSRPQDGYLR